MLNLIAGKLAVISGESLLSALITLAIWGIIFYVIWWGFGKLALPEPWAKVVTFILVLLTVVVLINVLLGLDGRAFIRW